MPKPIRPPYISFYLGGSKVSSAAKLAVIRPAFEQLRTWLGEEEGRAAEAANRKLIGNCYRTHDKYAGSELGSGEFAVYFRVDAVSGSRVTYFTFFVDRRGKVVFEPHFISSNMFAKEYQAITRHQFDVALKHAKKRIVKMSKGAA